MENEPIDHTVYLGKSLTLGFCDDPTHVHMDLIFSDGSAAPLACLNADEVAIIISDLLNILAILRGMMAMPPPQSVRH